MDSYTIITVFMGIFMAIMVVLCLAMIVIVALQEGSDAKLGAITGSAESFFGKNKAKTTESKFKRWTIITGAGILVSSIVYFILQLLLIGLE
ncbi:MAG: preprotein translocase subunit SecG [Clostridia bacterium]